MEYYSGVLTAMPPTFLTAYLAFVFVGAAPSTAAFVSLLPTAVLLFHALFVGSPGGD